MKKITLFIFIFSSFWAVAQEDAWVYFTNKPDAAHYLANPLEMLSQRALDRRTAQNISLDIKDVPISVSYINQVTASTGITVKAKSKWLNCLHIRGSVADIQNLTALTFVDHIKFADASLNARRPISRTLSPVNKQMDIQTTFNYGNSANQIEMLNGHLLHQANYTGTGKIIAVLDSGFMNVNSATPFQRLFTNNLILGGYNYVSQSTDIYSLHTHGTLTLSCMGGFVEGQLVGTAPDAQYYLFVTEDVTGENPVEESYWVEAAEEADRLGVDIISSSLGYYRFDNPNYGHDYDDFTGNEAFASKGANIAFSKGMIVVASAGNSGMSPDPLNRVGVPAEATNVLAVGAVRENGARAIFSSLGPTFDGRIKPDVMAQGQPATVAYNDVMVSNGTSFSCPIIAGMVASFWQAVPTLTNQQVIDFIKQSADRHNNPDIGYGYGIPDFGQALANAMGIPDLFSPKFTIYPNPADSVVNFYIPGGFEKAQVFVYNELGQEVLQKEIQNSDPGFSVEKLTPGIYFYRIETNANSYTGKLAKK